jgi:hypothetical protein
MWYWRTVLLPLPLHRIASHRIPPNSPPEYATSIAIDVDVDAHVRLMSTTHSHAPHRHRRTEQSRAERSRGNEEVSPIPIDYIACQRTDPRIGLDRGIYIYRIPRTQRNARHRTALHCTALHCTALHRVASSTREWAGPLMVERDVGEEGSCALKRRSFQARNYLREEEELVISRAEFGLFGIRGFVFGLLLVGVSSNLSTVVCERERERKWYLTCLT